MAKIVQKKISATKMTNTYSFCTKHILKLKKEIQVLQNTRDIYVCLFTFPNTDMISTSCASSYPSL